MSLRKTPPPAETANTVDVPSIGGLRFTWKIENFSSLSTDKLYSSTFCIGANKWRLLLFPKGNNTKHLSMYVDVPDSGTLPHGWSRYAEFSLAVIDQIHNENTIRKKATHQFNSQEDDWGFTSLLPLSELHDPKRGYLVNDTIIVEADFTDQSHDSKKESGYVELKNEGDEQGNEEESQHPSLQDDNSGNVVANNGISGEEVSSLEPVRQDVAPSVDKGANQVPSESTLHASSPGTSPPQQALQPTSGTQTPSVNDSQNGSSEVTPAGDTCTITQAGVHASGGQASNNIRGRNILHFEDAAPASKVKFMSYWVSSEASLVLERIHDLHKDTFAKFSMKGSILPTMLLESFATFIESMSTTKVCEVNEEALCRAALAIEDFEQVSLNLSWLKQRLDEVKRVNKHTESLISAKSYESALEVARAKVRKLEGWLANAKAEVEVRSKELPKSLGVDDYVLKDVV